MQKMATNWPFADEIEACKDDVVVAILKVIVGNKILTENHVTSLIYLFRLNPKQLDIKTRKKKYRSCLVVAVKGTREEERGEP